MSKRHRKRKSEASTLESALIAHLGTKREKSENQLFGEFVARSLDGMTNEQKFLVSSKIHEILFHVKNGSQVVVQAYPQHVQQQHTQPQHAQQQYTQQQYAQQQYMQLQYLEPTTGQQNTTDPNSGQTLMKL